MKISFRNFRIQIPVDSYLHFLKQLISQRRAHWINRIQRDDEMATTLYIKWRYQHRW